MKTRLHSINFQVNRFLGKKLFLLFLTFLSIALPASASDRTDTKQVLILQSQHQSDPPLALIEQGIRTTSRQIPDKEASFWDLYKWRLISLACFCIIGTLLIVGLIMQRKKRSRVEEKLSVSEQRYLQALSGSTDGLWDWDIQSGAVFFSDRFKEILGFSAGEFPGTMDSFRSRLHPEDADAAWTAIERHLHERIPFKVEYRLRTKSGGYLWFSARAQAIWDAQGNAARMSGWIQDITENKQSELDLKAAFSEINGLKAKLEAEKAYLQDEIKFQYNHENIIGESEGLTYVLYKVEQIASTDTTVLILGETGTGKELVARAIHNRSLRKDRALVKINCATLTSNLIESELFGHEKGAFTGAHARKLGRFEVAHEATLFLDEIGELPLELQPKLLRVIESGEFERLGSSHTIKVDVRILAATNRDLEEEVRRGQFREDLWFRLNVFPITVPPLRERANDIPLLVGFYVDKISKRLGKSIENIPASVMDTLRNYHWPGNVRELENVLERAVLNSSGTKLRLVDELKKQSIDSTTPLKSMKDVERDHIVRVLEQTHWKVSGKDGAAEILGLDRSTLRARMRKLGIRQP
jgi:PAS domain S-box-containing protein